MLKFFRLPFATTGDKTAVPDAVDSNGNVSYSQGYGFDYQRQKTDPAAKNIERDKMNQVFFDITSAIAELQSQGVPDYITSALNGGTAYSYGQYAIVKYSGDLYISLVAANTALPSDATKWALLPIPARLQSALNIRATAGGTADALTGAFTPAIAALPAAPDTLSVMVRAASANATTTPTFKADGTTAKTIVKGNNLPLAAGDIAGAGHWLHFNYDATLDKWVLLNPATGVSGNRVGQMAGTANYSASATLTASALGKLVTFTGSTAAQTLTFPAVSSGLDGAAIEVVNLSSVPVTLARGGTDTFALASNTGAITGVTSLVLQPGESSLFVGNAAGAWNEGATDRALSAGTSVYASAAQSVPTNTYTILNFNLEEWDDLNVHDNVTNNSRLTIAYAGRYRVTGIIRWNTANNCGKFFELVKNGSGIYRVSDPNATNVTDSGQAISVEMTLAEGDYLQLGCQQNSGIAVNTDPAATRFQLTRLK